MTGMPATNKIVTNRKEAFVTAGICSLQPSNHHAAIPSNCQMHLKMLLSLCPTPG